MVFRLLMCFLLCGLTAQAQGLRINEVMSKNYSDFVDADGDDSDWIELYNASNEGIYLGDFFLSDEENDLEKWVLPDQTLAQGAYLVLFANGDPELDAFSTNFSISSAGETIYLSNNLGVESLDVPELLANESYGLNEAGEYVVYSSASPGADNSLGAEEFRIEFSHNAGFYDEQFFLSLSAKDPSIEIRYTLDGNDPSVEASLYNGALAMTSREGDPNVHSANIMHPVNDAVPTTEVQKCNIVSAQAYRDGEAIGKVYRQSIFVDDAGVNRYSLPVVSIISEPDNFFDPEFGMMVPGTAGFENLAEANYWNDWEDPAHIELFLEGSLAYASNIGVKIHGGGSRVASQKSLKIFTQKSFGQKKFEFPFFQNTERKKWDDLVLKSIVARANLCGFNDELVYDITNTDSEWNVEGSAYEFVVLFIDGEYWGIYSLREKLNVDFITKYHDIEEESLDFMRNVSIHNQNVLHGDTLGYGQLTNQMKELDMSDPTSVDFIESQIDLENFLDYFIIETYGNNWDWITHNMLFFKDRNDPEFRWTFRVWDMDFAFHQANKVMLLKLLNLDDEYQDVFIEPWDSDLAFLFRKIFESPIMRQRLLDRYKHHLENTLCEDNLIAMIDEHEEILSPDIEEHILRYKSDWTDLAFWESEVERIRNYMRQRPTTLIDQLNALYDLDLGVESCEVLSTGIDSGNEPNDFLSIVNGAVHNLGTEPVDLHIVNLSGQVMGKRVLGLHETVDLNLLDLATGVYVLQYERSGVSFGKKVFVP